MVAMFIMLIGGDRQYANQLTGLFSQFLDNGWAFNDIRTEILRIFYDSRSTFRWQMFQRKKDENIISQRETYYHKQLKLVSQPSVATVDINNGTIVSRTEESYLERAASYTIQEFIQYFYSVMPVDLQAQPPTRMAGILKYKIKQYGIDKLLFMVDICAEECKINNKIFSLSDFDNYSVSANNRIEEIKANIVDTYYTPKKRRLFE